MIIQFIKFLYFEFNFQFILCWYHGWHVKLYHSHTSSLDLFKFNIIILTAINYILFSEWRNQVLLRSFIFRKSFSAGQHVYSGTETSLICFHSYECVSENVIAAGGMLRVPVSATHAWRQTWSHKTFCVSITFSWDGFFVSITFCDYNFVVNITLLRITFCDYNFVVNITFGEHNFLWEYFANKYFCENNF